MQKVPDCVISDHCWVQSGGRCWPSLTGGTCPTGWTQYNPGSRNFCYFPITGVYIGHDEAFRECQQMGADLTYIESTAEVNYLESTNIIDVTYNYPLNAHRFRYGPFGRCTEEISPAKYRQSIISQVNNIAGNMSPGKISPVIANKIQT